MPLRGAGEVGGCTPPTKGHLPRPNGADDARVATGAVCLYVDPDSGSVTTPPLTSHREQKFGSISKYPFDGDIFRAP